jgi:AraC-like DNA-binding protein
MTVQEVLTSLGYGPTEVQLGYAVLDCDSLSKAAWDELSQRLTAVGLELLSDDDIVCVERIKIALLRFARTDGGLKIKLSQALEAKLGIPYKNLTATFSRIEGRTLENYFISQRIEYVKELISYGELSLTEIAYRTGYSSVAYLSKQFSQIVGITVTEYRSMADDMRTSLTEV